MSQKKTAFYHPLKRGFCLTAAGILTLSLIPAAPLTASAAPTDKPALMKAGSVPVMDENFTKGGPFPEGTGGSQHFRIPAISTMADGGLIAVADARYDRLSGDGSSPDGGGLDTIASISHDGGKTWHYSFPIYFPDSAQNAGNLASTIIDPGLIVGPDGTIYCIADVNPTGVTTMGGFRAPGHGTGFVDVDGEKRLALTSDFNGKAKTRPDADGAGYEYYVGDFENGYAPVLNMSDNEASEYCVDEWYNLYSVDEGGNRTELKQTQVDSEEEIQQNAFYQGSALHVYETGYLWMVSSTDNGRTWGNPTILNTQLKRSDDENDKALLVSPGKGITTSSGDMAIGFYNWKPGREAASIAYSTDNGATWSRTEDMQTVPGTEIDTSSENEIVELKDGTLRMFFRHGGYVAPVGKLCYVDAKKQADGSYALGTAKETSFALQKGCNLSALSYSKTIDGKQVILVSAPSEVRANGVILTLTVNEDGTMEELHRFPIPGGQGGYGTFVYSCLTELEDGSIGLLWEPSHKAINYSRFTINETGELSPYAATADVTVERGQTYAIPDYEGALDIAKSPDSAIATVTFSDGSLIFTGIGEGYATAVIDGVTYDIQVTDTHPEKDPSCAHASTVTKNQKEPGCESNGYSGDTICSQCNAILEKGATMPGGHTWDLENGVTVKEVNRENDGEKLYSCTRDSSHKKTEIIYASTYSLLADACEDAAKLSENAGMYENPQGLLEAYAAASAMMSSHGASRPEMHKRITALQLATASLTLRSKDALTRDLNSAIAAAKADAAAPNGLPNDIYQELKSAYDKASQADPAKLTEEEIFRLTAALTAAQKKTDAAKEALKEQAKANLAAAINNAKAIYEAGQKNYTSDSWNAFADAYGKAANPPSNADAAAIKALCDSLKAAQSKLVSNPIAPGDTKKYKNVTYKVLDASSHTVSAAKCASKKAAKIKIEDKVKINGVVCKVVQIDAKAFQNCGKLKEVTVGANVTAIGKQCFQNCRALKKVTFKGTAIKEIKSKAFLKTASNIKVSVPKKMKKPQRNALLKKLKSAGISKKVKL